MFISDRTVRGLGTCSGTLRIGRFIRWLPHVGTNIPEIHAWDIGKSVR